MPVLQVATVVRIEFDLSLPRVAGQYSILQLKMLSSDEYVDCVAWSIAATCFVALSLVMALPAAYQVIPGSRVACRS